MLILTLSSHEILFVVHETINILLCAGCHSEKGSQYGNCETEMGQPCQINSGGFYWNAEYRLCWSILQYAVEPGEELPDDIYVKQVTWLGKFCNKPYNQSRLPLLVLSASTC